MPKGDRKSEDSGLNETPIWGLAGNTFAQTFMPGANKLALLTRHSTYLLVAIVALADSHPHPAQAGKLVIAALGAWAVVRLATRSLRGIFTAIDCTFVLAMCGVAPLLSANLGSVPTVLAVSAVVCATIVGFAVGLPVRASMPITCLLLASYAWGRASIGGPQDLATMFSVYHLAIAAAVGVIIRMTLLRVADATRQAHENYVRAGEFRQRIVAAERDYEREQFALLHDTAASTMLLVGNGTPVPPDRLAAQARRALAVLNGRQPPHPRRRGELVAALRETARGACTPVALYGRSQLWLDGDIGGAVAAAVGEVLNNVDRHADATGVSIDISDHRVVITDNGCGFTSASTTGHGIAESIVGRMNRIGGAALIRSAPGQGTTVEISWPRKPRSLSSPTSVTEADRLVGRVRTRYRYALIGCALLVIILSLPYSLTSEAHPIAQAVMAALAAIWCLTAVWAYNRKNQAVRWIAIIALVVVAVAQQALLPDNLVSTIAQWSLWAIGWCLSPLLLGLPLRVAISVLAVYWTGTCAATFARVPTADTLVTLGLIGASLGVLLVSAQVADRVFAKAAADARAQTEAHLDLLVRQRAAAAAHSDFRRRVADIRQRVVPFLVKLSNGDPVDSRLRQRALVESRSIRTFLDQQASGEHPLLQALRPAMDAAIQRNVDVTVHVESGLPTLTEADVNRLAPVVAQIFGNCTQTLRFVLTCVGDELIVSAVCRGYRGEPEGTPDAPPAANLDVVSHDDATWFTIRHRLPNPTPNERLDYDCAS
jgi:histidine kinase/DNA gyrase B/HSP90-like ATPase